MDGLAVLGIIGGVAVLAALYGGIEVYGIKIPALPTNIRIISAIFGVVLIGYMMWIIDKQSSPVPQIQANQTSTSIAPIIGTTPISQNTPTHQPTFQSQSSPTSQSQSLPTITIEASLPSAIPTTLQSNIITIPTVQALSYDLLCTYNVDKFSLIAPIYADNVGQSYDLTQPEFPDGEIIGNGVAASYNNKVLGNSGVTFIIPIVNHSERSTLSLRDGIFYIVSPENAEGFLALRVRQIEECEGKQKGYVRYPSVTTAPTATIMPVRLPQVCGFEAFNGDSLYTTSPLFKRPEGYTSGWITSDQSNLILPDGTKKTIPTRYALIVENLAEVQLLNVRIGDNNYANSWGCWYNTDINEVMSDAEFEYDKMKTQAPTVPVALYRLTSQGLEKLKP